MFTHDAAELDALILVGDDPVSAERCLAALVAVSLDVPLRTWVIEVRADKAEHEALQDRCVWTRGVEARGPVSARVDRAVSQGHAPLVLFLDGSHAIHADTVRALVEHMRRNPELAAAGLGALEDQAHVVRPGSAGPALLLRRAALERVGALLEGNCYAGLQSEAEAWCRRAEREGLAVQLSSAAPRVVERAAQPAPRLELRLQSHAFLTPRGSGARLDLGRGPSAVDAFERALRARSNRPYAR